MCSSDLGQPKGLFAKIEDDLIVRLEEKLAKAIGGEKALAEPPKVEAKNEAQESVKEKEDPKSKEISLEMFQTLDIRMGEILEACKVPKGDKLLQLKIKVGEEVRQVVSGIAKQYQPESLVGKKVPVLLNLKPAKIRGIESQGMILCADVEGSAVLLFPEKDVPSGSVVR